MIIRKKTRNSGVCGCAMALVATMGVMASGLPMHVAMATDVLQHAPSSTRQLSQAIIPSGGHVDIKPQDASSPPPSLSIHAAPPPANGEEYSSDSSREVGIPHDHGPVDISGAPEPIGDSSSTQALSEPTGATSEPLESDVGGGILAPTGAAQPTPSSIVESPRQELPPPGQPPAPGGGGDQDSQIYSAVPKASESPPPLTDASSADTVEAIYEEDDVNESLAHVPAAGGEYPTVPTVDESSGEGDEWDTHGSTRGSDSTAQERSVDTTGVTGSPLSPDTAPEISAGHSDSELSQSSLNSTKYGDAPPTPKGSADNRTSLSVVQEAVSGGSGAPKLSILATMSLFSVVAMQYI